MQDSSSNTLGSNTTGRNMNESKTIAKLFRSARLQRDEDLSQAVTAGEDAVLAGFRKHTETTPLASQGSAGDTTVGTGADSNKGLRLLPFVASAAALVLVLFGTQRFLASNDASNGEAVATLERTESETFQRPAIATLGAQDLECVSPVGVVERYAEFQWTGTLAPGESFDLAVFDLSHSQAVATVLIEDLLETRVTLNTTDTQKLSGSIRWEVRVRGANGRLTERVVAGTASLNS